MVAAKRPAESSHPHRPPLPPSVAWSSPPPPPPPSPQRSARRRGLGAMTHTRAARRLRVLRGHRWRKDAPRGGRSLRVVVPRFRPRFRPALPREARRRCRDNGLLFGLGQSDVVRRGGGSRTWTTKRDTRSSGCANSEEFLAVNEMVGVIHGAPRRRVLDIIQKVRIIYQLNFQHIHGSDVPLK